MNSFIQLIRPSNFIIAFLSIGVAAVLAGGTSGQWMAIGAACASGALIGGAGMVINDLLDIEIDRINKPNRPLVTGAVHVDQAKLLYMVLNAAGLAFGFLLPPHAQYIALFAVLFIYAYSAYLKRTVLFGNIAVGFMTGLAFIYGGATVGCIERALLPALFAFLMNTGREIIKDMEDVEGDRLNGAITLPVKYGMNAAAGAATVFLTALVIAAFYPYAADMYSMKYLIIVTCGVIGMVGYVIGSLWGNRSVENLHRLSTIIKYDMIVGLIAIYVG